METRKPFVPALGHHAFTGAYDRVVALTTREQRWRAELLRQVAPKRSDRVLDVGCGTGTFALMLARACPAAQIIGVDPDEAVLRSARRKAGATSVAWHRGYGDDLREVLGGRTVTKVISSLVLHQCALPIKRAILRSMFEVCEPNGELFIADYGQQRTSWMRLLFLPVQLLDGLDVTQPNADGLLPQLIRDAGFSDVHEIYVLPTPTGSISVYRGTRNTSVACCEHGVG